MRIASIGLVFVGLSLMTNASVLPTSAQNAAKPGAIEIRRIEIERVTIKSSRPFQVVVSALESAVGRPDMAAFAKALKNAGSYSEIEQLVDRSVSQLGLMLFARFDDGEILQKESGLDKPKIVRFLIGNPLIMKEMAKHVPDAGAYAPVTILVDERSDGVHLTYDKMASLLAPYGNSLALSVAQDLDKKIENLLRLAAGT
jgi:uncharacterized protein (DUF302 family)